MSIYDGTIKYWDDVFGQIEYYEPLGKIKFPELEKGICWISTDSESVLDFGSGSGKVLFRCLENGVTNGCGIDISKGAINLANNVAKSNNLLHRVKFINGGVDVLKEIVDNSYDCAILFNILDNLRPLDAMEVIKGINRIVKESGKILIKLNPYLDESKINDYNFTRIDEDFYHTETGLYFWNLSNVKFNEIIKSYFTIEDFVGVEYKWHGVISRMFYLRNLNNKMTLELCP